MPVVLSKLRYSNPVAFAAVVAKAKELASVRKKDFKADTDDRGRSQVDERLRLQREWNRTSNVQQNPSDPETEDQIALAMMTLFPSQPHPEV